MDFSKKVELRAFTLADPNRVVIDLPQVTFNLPARPARPAAAWSRRSASASSCRAARAS